MCRPGKDDVVARELTVYLNLVGKKLPGPSEKGGSYHGAPPVIAQHKGAKAKAKEKAKAKAAKAKGTGKAKSKAKADAQLATKKRKRGKSSSLAGATPFLRVGLVNCSAALLNC